MSSRLLIDAAIAAGGGVAGGYVASVSGLETASGYGSFGGGAAALPAMAGSAAALYFVRGYPLGTAMLPPITIAAGAAYLFLFYTLRGMKINAL